MKLTKAVIILISSLMVASALPTLNEEDTWDAFKIKYGKTYSSQEEENLRMKIFQENKIKVEEHNRLYVSGHKSYALGLNKFSDLSFDEFKRTMTGFHLPAGTQDSVHSIPYKPPTSSDLPAELDWRTKGAVSEVKNQLYCGSCWAFSVVGTLESQNFLKNGKLVLFSEQNLVDCDPINHGCWGGDPVYAYDYIIKNKGIDTEDVYKYEAVDATCRFKRPAAAVQITGFTKLPSGNETALQVAVVNEGPISVCIFASANFEHYKKGVYYEEGCPQKENQLNHCVTLVGYGTENKQDYWLLKNSWGVELGDKGYFKLARNRGNNCGIATYATYPLVVKA